MNLSSFITDYRRIAEESLEELRECHKSLGFSPALSRHRCGELARFTQPRSIEGWGASEESGLWTAERGISNGHSRIQSVRSVNGVIFGYGSKRLRFNITKTRQRIYRQARQAAAASQIVALGPHYRAD
jgi:hypothetical protein